jgi:signal transduction histidine kinase
VRDEVGDARSANPLSRRLASLEGLPIRPATARAVLAQFDPRLKLEPSSSPERLDADPGWVARLLSASNAELDRIAAAPWWHNPHAEQREAIERLWRYAAAIAWTARNLAFHRGSGDPRRIAWFGLLAPLGPWVLAAAAPECLPEWLNLHDPIARHRWERDQLGEELGWIGRTAALRWKLPRLLIEAAWLLDEPDDFPIDLEPADAEALDLLRHARAWVERTPFRLHANPDEPAPVSTSIEMRQWMAGLQAWLPSSLFDPKATAAEERVCQSLARHLATIHRRDHLEQSLHDLIRRLAELRPGDPPADWPVPDSALASADPTHAALAAVGELLAENQRLAATLRHAVRAARPRRAEHERRERQELLDALAEFAAGAGHELNNPLAVIVGRAQLLIHRLSHDPEAQRSLRTIIAQAQRAHRMLRDLMYVARPTPDRLRLCQPEEIIRRGVDDLRPEADARRIRLDYLPASPAQAALCDPDQLRHLVEILLRNAIDASPSDAAILIETERQADQLLLRVADQGPGLDPDEARHVLLPFYSGRHAGRGLGLGLPRIARYLDSIGGRLDWSARPGGGTVFRVHLPLAKELPRAAS